MIFLFPVEPFCGMMSGIILCMTPILTDDQRQALDAEGGAPVFVFDEKRHSMWVLVSMQEFERVRPLFHETEFPVGESYPMQDVVARAGGWDSPRMEAYNTYAEQPPSV